MPVLPANKGQRGRSLRNVGGSHVVGRGNMPVVWKHNEAWKTEGKEENPRETPTEKNTKGNGKYTQGPSIESRVT